MINITIFAAVTIIFVVGSTIKDEDVISDFNFGALTTVTAMIVAELIRYFFGG